MPPENGKRTPLTLSYSWGQQGLEAQFAGVFQPGQAIFSPGYPLAPPAPSSPCCATARTSTCPTASGRSPRAWR